MIFTGPIVPVTTPSLDNVDEWNADVLKNAVRFTTTLFLGTGNYETIDTESIMEAKEAISVLKEAHPDANREVMVYAFDAAGNRTILSGKPYKAPKGKKPAKEAETALPLLALGNKPAATGKKAKMPALENALNSLIAPPKKAKAAKAPKAEKVAKEPKAPKAPKEPKVKGPSKWDAARELLVRPEGVQKEALFAVLKWRSMSIPLLLAQTGLASVEKIDGGWKGAK